MAAQQSVFFTVLPRTHHAGGTTLPVSVVVSPRLQGEDRLGNYPDWLTWTRHLAVSGLALDFRCAGATHRVSIDQGALQPDLWEELFRRETLVRSHEFDDYSGRGIVSFPMREALSAVKSIYQQAAVTLALPSPPSAIRDRSINANRERLKGLIKGLEVHWNGDRARFWRDQVRRSTSRSGAWTPSGIPKNSRSSRMPRTFPAR